MATTRIAVVGGTGFIGFHIVNELLANDYDVTVIARNHMNEPPSAWQRRVSFVRLDTLVATTEEFKSAFLGHQGVIFAAGADAIDKNIWKKNVIAVEHMMRGARDAGCDRTVILGSYFTNFICHDSPLAREWLRDHLYMKSRIEQAKVARDEGGDQITVAI